MLAPDSYLLSTWPVDKVVMSLGKAYLIKELFAHLHSRAQRVNVFHVSTCSPTTPLGASLFLQLWLGSCCTTPSTCTAQSQSDCGTLPASQHSGLSHEDGASEQPSGVSPQGQYPASTQVLGRLLTISVKGLVENCALGCRWNLD